MQTALGLKNRKQAFRLVWAQLTIVSLATLCALIWGIKASYSIFIGGFIGIVPSLYFVFKAFKYVGAQSAQKVIKAFYVGAAVKLFLTIVLFIAVYLWVPVSMLGTLIGFTLVILVQLFAPIIVKTP